MEGVLLAATFSWGCETANLLGITPLLREYTESKGRSCSETEIRGALKKLFSYFYYKVIAESNRIEDPFDFRVVEAHWIGNELLKNINMRIIGKVFREMQDDYDKVVLAYVAEPLIKTGSAHHNAYARYNQECSVTVRGDYFYHLGEKRMAISSEKVENLAKYGKR